MAGKITHEWNGTVLTITSDSGTSSADLKGETGQRGAQGAAGIGINGVNGRDGIDGKDGRDGRDGRDGVDGTVSFDNLTEAQRASLKGENGKDGIDYKITYADYEEIANIVLANYVDGEEREF